MPQQPPPEQATLDAFMAKTIDVVCIRTEDNGLLRLRRNDRGRPMVCDVRDCESRGRFSETLVRSLNLHGDQLFVHAPGMRTTAFTVMTTSTGRLALDVGAATAAAVEANEIAERCVRTMFAGHPTLQEANLPAVLTRVVAPADRTR